MSANPYRSLPRVDAVIRALEGPQKGPEHALYAEVARASVESAREAIAAGEQSPTLEEVVSDAKRRHALATHRSLRQVINATGVIIHTNLGRAPMTADMLSRALGYCNLEYNLTEGGRGSRGAHVSALLCAMTDAEAALVVNNNAAATLLMLAGLAKNQEVVISRGELVEIGGSFRVPDIMETSGARLREVGTTNRTYARDYEDAIGPETAALLRVHPSNFAITGFTHHADSRALRAVADRHQVLLLHDLGSGTLGPLPSGLVHGPSPADELNAGVDVLCFSGDKLLGGPQCGILLGRKNLIDQLAKHPLARALRPDKLTLAALEETLLRYRRGAEDTVPVSRMLNTSQATLHDRATRMASLLSSTLGEWATITTAAVYDRVGGGSYPESVLPGWAVVIAPHDISVTDLATQLRHTDHPLITVIDQNKVHLHLRTVLPNEDDAVCSALIHALRKESLDTSAHTP